MLAGTAPSFICEIDSFFTVGDREAIFLVVYLSFASCLEVNSICYTEYQ